MYPTKWHNTDCRQVKEFERYVEMAKKIEPDVKYKKRDQFKYMPNNT